MLAHTLNQYQSLLTYLDQYEKVAPGEAWTNYYQASGLLRLGRAAEAA